MEYNLTNIIKLLLFLAISPIYIYLQCYLILFALGVSILGFPIILIMVLIEDTDLIKIYRFILWDFMFCPTLMIIEIFRR